MARSQMKNSASSQFFICHQNAAFLDGQYASFGEVIQGMENVDKIAATKTDSGDRPRVNQVMNKVYFVEEK
jgi:peptidyl-prolyl cis-trans isomerase B (cyclophilin B)